MCPKLRLPSHVATASHPVDNGDYNRSVETRPVFMFDPASWLPVFTSARKPILPHLQPRCLWCRCPRDVYGTDGTGSVSAGSA